MKSKFVSEKVILGDPSFARKIVHLGNVAGFDLIEVQSLIY